MWFYVAHDVQCVWSVNPPRGVPRIQLFCLCASLIDRTTSPEGSCTIINYIISLNQRVRPTPLYPHCPTIGAVRSAGYLLIPCPIRWDNTPTWRPAGPTRLPDTPLRRNGTQLCTHSSRHYAASAGTPCSYGRQVGLEKAVIVPKLSRARG